METAFDNETLALWLNLYGSVALFFLLAFGIFALPVPDETLLVLSGILMFNNRLPIHSTIFYSYAGSMCGITLSYLLGRTAGSYIIHKMVGWLGIKEHHLQKAHDWFEHLGKWTLVFGYFLPGVRHVTGILAGMTELNFRQFALYAYFGAVLWVSSFLALGYFLGDYVISALPKLEFKMEYVIFGIIICVGGYLLYRYYKR